ncbi:MAG: cell envelope integrity protein TolA [Pyrinomonadaceae bacterium]
MKFLLALGTITLFSFAVFAQTRVITNADLEKYRVKRLAAEKELRENYKAMGFKSPEEQAKQDEKDRKETEELAAKLRAERIAKEDARAQQQEVVVVYADEQEAQQVSPQADFIDYSQYSTSTYYGSRSFPYYRGFQVRLGFGNRNFGGSNRNYRRPVGGVNLGNQNRGNANIRSSRRLTNENLRNTRRNDVRGFGFGISTRLN